MGIKSLADLEKFFGKNTQKFVLDQALKIAQEQSSYLETLIRSQFLAYYASYTPVVYERTNNLLNSIKINPPIIMGNEVVMSVGFNEELANHPSLWGADDSYFPLELDTGWHINWSKPYRIPRLSDFAGFPWIQVVIEEFNKTNKYGIKIHAYMDGNLID